MRPHEAIERRRNLLRVILFLIILGTLPFYLLGFWLWGTAPDPNAPDGPTEETLVITNTPIGSNPTETPRLLPTTTPRPTSTDWSPLRPTPPQFIPPTSFILPTAYIPPTQFILPTATSAPTLTPLPTNTPPPTITPGPTLTPLLPPTDTPQAETTEEA